jgi:hypothetical protein
MGESVSIKKQKNLSGMSTFRGTFRDNNHELSNSLNIWMDLGFHFMQFDSTQFHSKVMTSVTLIQAENTSLFCFNDNVSQSSEHRYQPATIFESERLWSCRITINFSPKLHCASHFSLDIIFESFAFSSRLLIVDPWHSYGSASFKKKIQTFDETLNSRVIPQEDQQQPSRSLNIWTNSSFHSISSQSHDFTHSHLPRRKPHNFGPPSDQ